MEITGVRAEIMTVDASHVYINSKTFFRYLSLNTYLVHRINNILNPKKTTFPRTLTLR